VRKIRSANRFVKAVVVIRTLRLNPVPGLPPIGRDWFFDRVNADKSIEFELQCHADPRMLGVDRFLDIVDRGMHGIVDFFRLLADCARAAFLTWPAVIAEIMPVLIPEPCQGRAPPVFTLARRFCSIPAASSDDASHDPQQLTEGEPMTYRQRPMTGGRPPPLGP
jgi:hypothetical protein